METFPTWIRLHPASEDETLAVSVQARIHDPLWLLGRQWQFGELRHDGGATPIDVRVEGTTAPLSRMRGGGADVTTGRSAAIKPTGTPLEALVEREAVRETGLEQLRLRAEAGLHLLRMLRAAGLPDRARRVLDRRGRVRAAGGRGPRRRGARVVGHGGGPYSRRRPSAGRHPGAPGRRRHAADRSTGGHRAARVAVVGGRPFRAAGVRTVDMVAGAHGVRVLGRAGLARRAKCC